MATDAEWENYTGQRYKGRPSGNAKYAMKVRATNLDAKSILDMVVASLQYYGDRYYEPLTTPVDMRVAEFYKSIKEEEPG